MADFMLYLLAAIVNKWLDMLQSYHTNPATLPCLADFSYTRFEFELFAHSLQNPQLDFNSDNISPRPRPY